MRHKHRHLPITFTGHALTRLAQRNISRYEVVTIIRAGARRADGVNKWIAYGSIRGQFVQVPYVFTHSHELKTEVVLVLTGHN